MKKRSNSSAPEKAQSPSFPVVVIGASAGGIQAVTRLFKNVSPTTGMAFVYVQHLEPTHQSMLPEILARATSMKIHQPRRIMQMAPNHVYVCPPDKDMIIQNGYIKLVNRPAGHAIHLPIDKLFLSAAGNSKSRGVIGILLSGNSSDGAAGMKAIKSAGGVTFAQDETAQFDVMPRSAVSAGAVDISLPPEAIAAELDRLSSNINEIKDMPGEAETSNIIPPGADLDEIFQIISSAVGVDFSLYKKTTIRRRIARRMLLLKQPTLKEYITYLKEHADEVTALYRDVLINVTSFFRDTDTMQYLKRKILPRLLKNRKAGETVRVWVPGCSSGEEAYSIAILFMEVLGEKASNTGIQLFATDLSETAISRARAGVYTPMQLEGVSPERIQRFFTKADGNYRIAKFIRDLCIFSIHNVFKDPPFSRIDLVSCSNLFIYLESLLQKKILTAFHYALNDGGFLVLGKSETIGPSKNLFAPLDKKIKVFTRKKDITSRLLPEMNLHQLSAWKDYHSAELKKGSRGEADYEKMLERLANEKLLQKYVPASVVVNQDLEILQFRGSTGLFLEPSPGKASLNLLKMARPGLGFELKKAVHKVIKTGEHYKKDDLEIKSGNKTCIVNIEVEPLIKDSNENIFLIIFSLAAFSAKLPAASGKSAKDRRIRQLEQELVAAREDMRAIIEEQEAANEELQSANEEVVSSNEELQSINEELETSKEEIESANEELMTINHEMEERNQQLDEAQEYSELIISTILEAVLVLDKDFKIKTANDAFYNIFRTGPEETIGKLIFELGNGEWNIPALHKLLEEIIPRKSEFLGLEINHVFRNAGEKTLVFNAKKTHQQNSQQYLIFLAIENVTERVAAQKIIAEREAWFRNIANNAPALVWVADVNGQRTFFNKAWLNYTGRKMEQELGKGWQENVYKEDLGQLLSVLNTGYKQHKPYKLQYRLRRFDGEYRWIQATGNPTFLPDGTFSGFIGACYEVHEQRLTKEELEKKIQERTLELTNALENEKGLSELKSQFVSTASHEFRTPLTTILSSIELLERYTDEKYKERREKHYGRIKLSVQSLIEILNDFLSLEKLEQRKIQVNTEQFDIKKHIKDTVDSLIVTFKTGQQVVYKHTGKTEIKLDEKILRSILTNLVSNASKFSGPGKKIQVNSKVNNGIVIISVKDQGIGIPEQDKKHLFEKFFRASNTTGIQGTGLGLNIVKQYMQLLGGTIHIKSELSKGSTFRVEIPFETSL